MEIQQLVAEYIEKHALLIPGQRVVVGVSGGPDSLCLLTCLHSLGYEIVLAHLDHQLRSESGEEARFVEEVGRRLRIVTFIEKGDVRKLADDGYSLEEAARIVRYRFLVRVAREVGVDSLATGHTADDQVETVLMHFLRGAGPSGLRGMLPSTLMERWVGIPDVQGIRLIRPLLGLKRSQTEAFCKHHHLDPVMDPSNQDPTFFRNRIRHQLIPLLRSYNPGIEDILLRMSEVMATEADWIEKELQDSWERLILDTQKRYLRFDLDGFRIMPEAMQRAFLRHAIKVLSPQIRDIGFDHIDQAVQFLGNDHGSSRRQLFAGLEALRISNEAILRSASEEIPFPNFPQLLDLSRIDVSSPSRTQLACGWELRVERQEIDASNREKVLSNLDDRTAALDRRYLSGHFHLRSPMPGDRFQPLGLHGRMKVSEFFINCRIPQPARKRWPLLMDCENIIWVVGLRIAHQYGIRSDTEELFVFRVIPPQQTG